MSISVNGQTFHLRTKNTSYIMDVYKGYLRHLYYGNKLEDDCYEAFYRNYFVGSYVEAELNTKDGSTLEVIPQELGTYGLGDYRENSFFARTEEGFCSFDLKYEGHTIHDVKPEFNMPHVRAGQTLEVRLFDPVTKVRVKLFYTPVEDAIVRRTEVENATDGILTVEKIDSFAMDIPNKNYSLVGLVGRYGRERDISVQELNYGIKTLQSTRGNLSSHQTNPFIALGENGYHENVGDAIGVALVYSGSFHMHVEMTHSSDLRVSGGISDCSLNWKLQPGESLSSAEAILVYSDQGMGEMSRRFHDVIRNCIIAPHFVHAKRPIVANTWEGCFFDFNEETLKQYVDNVVGTEIDTIVLDDGWFKGRNNDWTSLGDWVVDEEKLPNGLESIISYTKEKGFKFGLWFEPEMISEKSDLYEAHPDWAIAIPGRPSKLGRHQMLLDMCNPDVVAYLKNMFDGILSRYDLDYIKWDCNRQMSEHFSNALPADRQGELTHRYILGVYELLDHVTTKYPNVFIEGCAGGGGRYDCGMMYYTPQIWTSDATCAEERTYIQYGTSLLYPMSVISAHVSDVPNAHTSRSCPMKTRADIASIAVFGYETGFMHATQEEKDDVRKYVRRYNEIYDLVLTGDLYRLKNPFESNYFAKLILSKEKDRGFFVYYRRQFSLSLPQDRLYLQGLDPDATYNIPELEITAKGRTLMEFGLCLNLEWHDHDSILCHINKV